MEEGNGRDLGSGREMRSGREMEEEVGNADRWTGRVKCGQTDGQGDFRREGGKVHR